MFIRSDKSGSLPWSSVKFNDKMMKSPTAKSQTSKIRSNFVGLSSRSAALMVTKVPSMSPGSAATIDTDSLNSIVRFTPVEGQGMELPPLAAMTSDKAAGERAMKRSTTKEGRWARYSVVMRSGPTNWSANNVLINNDGSKARPGLTHLHCFGCGEIRMLRDIICVLLFADTRLICTLLGEVRRGSSHWANLGT